MNSYFRSLVDRAPLAQKVPYRFVEGMRPNECHLNAKRHAAATGTVVHGFLVNRATDGDPSFCAHSVVRVGGELVDVTPGHAQKFGLLFLEHEGTKEEFVPFLKDAGWHAPVSEDAAAWFLANGSSGTG